MVCDLVVLSVLRVVTVEVCKLPQHGWEITVYSASVMSRPGGGLPEGLRVSLVCLQPVTFLIHTFLLEVVSMSVRLIRFRLIPAGIAWG